LSPLVYKLLIVTNSTQRARNRKHLMSPHLDMTRSYRDKKPG